MSDPNDDVVFKLRNWKLRTDLRVAIDQAADEIEGLRADVSHLTFNRDHHAACNKSMHAELVGLRAAIEHALPWIGARLSPQGNPCLNEPCLRAADGTECFPCDVGWGGAPDTTGVQQP